MKTKPELRKALARILEKAKVHKAFSETEHERDRWDELLYIAYEVLEKPSMADIERYLDLKPQRS